VRPRLHVLGEQRWAERERERECVCVCVYVCVCVRFTTGEGGLVWFQGIERRGIERLGEMHYDIWVTRMEI
jgi:hypothetical protein